MLFLGFGMAAPARAQDCNFGFFEVGLPGLESLKGTPICGQGGFVQPGSSPWERVRNVLGIWLITLTIMAGLLVVVFGGYKYMVSAGDAGEAKKAKSWIGWALAGIALAVLSYIILQTINPAAVN